MSLSDMASDCFLKATLIFYGVLNLLTHSILYICSVQLFYEAYCFALWGSILHRSLQLSNYSPTILPSVLVLQAFLLANISWPFYSSSLQNTKREFNNIGCFQSANVTLTTHFWFVDVSKHTVLREISKTFQVLIPVICVYIVVS